MQTLKTDLGYFLPITTSIGLKELRWQKTPFVKLVNNECENCDVSCETINQLNLYLLGSLRSFSVPIDLNGWSATMVCWFKTLTLIPYGKTISYKDLASNWGNGKAARAAGQACRRNPIPIIIPCHRVISASGAVNLYSGGNRDNPSSIENLKRKKWLIQLETRNH